MGLYDNLFTPLAVGPVTLPNRIVRSAHGTLLSGERLIAYHEARAIGGVGMSTLEASGVHPTSPSVLPLWSDDVLPFFRTITERMRPHGMKLFQQLYHSGAATPTQGVLDEVWSASAIRNPLGSAVPRAMDQHMIDEIVAGFASAARRVRDGGLDGIDIHASSGYLIHEFLSPALNRREDGYGGSFENRLRFLKEVIAAIRAVIGHDIAIGVRLPNHDYVPGGIDPELAARIAAAIDPLVDYVSLHMGSYWRFHKLIAPADDPLGVEMAANAPITRVCAKPTIVVGRIMTLDHASALVANGEADLVSMVRALIADPELVNKGRRAQEHLIRPCIGTNIGCVGQLMTRGVLSCVVNPAAAREDELAFEPDQPADRPRHVLVVGGGPAGMEAARNAAMRGHRVELHEASRRLGGQARLAAQAPHRGDIGQIVRWQEAELDRLGVEVHLESPLGASDIAAIKAHAVILATGATPQGDGFQTAWPAAPVPGYDAAHVHDAWTLLGVGNRPNLIGPALVYDDAGTFEAISAAELLLAAGLEVTFASRFDKPGEALPFPPVTVGAARERLAQAGVTFLGGRYLAGIGPDSVDLKALHTDRVETCAARLVILAGMNQPLREVAQELDALGIAYVAAGDMLGRSDLLSAMHGGLELGRSV